MLDRYCGCVCMCLHWGLSHVEGDLSTDGVLCIMVITSIKAMHPGINSATHNLLST